ncbi:DUF3566 domain-containing protein [Pseudokineococcus basanitobsidens]|uniref:DUF3566 domain-containing protein n=1 Tax=Pseudokineococcus basanitobsidens TaxID=1926649 RepID=A0ABU8RNX6_9ACTN
MSGSQARPQQSGASTTGRTQGTQTARPRAEDERGPGPQAVRGEQARRPTGAPRPATGAGDQAAAPGAASPRTAAAAGAAQRRVRLSVSRVDPWSVLKLSFLVSVVVGIAVVVAAGTLWTVLDAVGVYDSVNSLIAQLSGTATVDVTDYVGFSQVVSAATVLAVVDVVIITALATLGAVVYNVSSTLVGGLRVTLTDD